MKKRYLLALGLIPMIHGSAQAQTIADWDFDSAGTVAAPDNTPAASIGSGSATQLGMNNSYTYAAGEGPGSVANCDVLATAGASTGAGSYAWRVRGNGNTANSGPGVANGWNSQAPIATQGAEFSASTVGYNNISLSFDLDTTGAAERNLAILYTLDGTTWQNAVITSAGSQIAASIANNTSSSSTIAGNYVQLSNAGTGWNNQITATFAGAGQDANFAVEIVNASTGTDDVNGSGTAYNNSSGNWRYDNVQISGTSVVPEPGAYPVLAVGAAAIIGLIRRKK
jgi:hypothetical protein